jgi:hypothetical protein
LQSRAKQTGHMSHLRYIAHQIQQSALGILGVTYLNLK